MKNMRIFPMIGLALLAVGCSSMLFKKTEPPIRYQLTYRADPVRCSASFHKGLRIWNFTAMSPYDQTQMAVVKPGGETLFSNNFQWVTDPGKMVSQNLLRDLAGSSMFPRVVGGNDPATVPLEMTGRVFEFAWKRSGETSQAVLQVAVSLAETGNNPRVLFRKTYELKSASLAKDSSEAFADAMSTLMSEFSDRLRGDLCATASSL